MRNTCGTHKRSFEERRFSGSGLYRCWEEKGVSGYLGLAGPVRYSEILYVYSFVRGWEIYRHPLFA